jgi:hypothetical protein
MQPYVQEMAYLFQKSNKSIVIEEWHRLRRPYQTLVLANIAASRANTLREPKSCVKREYRKQTIGSIVLIMHESI